MTVWSLATQPIDDNGIDVSLYLTEWQAYEGLLNIIAEYQSEDEDIREVDALIARLHAETLTDEVKKAIDQHVFTHDDLSSVDITQHDHPWTLGEVL